MPASHDSTALLHAELERLRQQVVELQKYCAAAEASEQGQREIAQRYRAILDSTYDWEYFELPNGLLYYVSPSCERLTGYTADQFLLNPDLLQAIILPEDRPIWVAHTAARHAAGPPCVIEFRIRHRDGSVCWIEHACQAVYDETGRYLGNRASNRTIQARKQVEEALRRSEEMFRCLVEQSRHGISLMDETGVVIEWNQAQAEITGLPRDQVIGKMLWDVQFMLVPESRKNAEYYQQLKASIVDFLVTGQAPWLNRPLQQVIYRPDGTRRIIEATVFPVQRQGGRLLASVMYDITALKNAQTELEAQRTFLRQIIDTIPNLIFVKDQAGRYVLANQAMAHRYLTTVEQLIGKTDAEVNPHPDQAQHYLSTDQAIFASREPLTLAEESVIDLKTGETRYFQTSKTPLRASDGSVQYILGVATDITRRKQAEQALGAARDELNAILHSVTEGIYVLDTGGRLVFVNEAAARVCGFSSAQDMLDNPPHNCFDNFDLYDEAGRPFALEQMPTYQAMRSLQAPPATVRLFDKRTRRARWVIVSAMPVKDENGQVRLVVVVTSDVTQIKETAEALRDSEGKLRHLIERSSDGIALIDEAGLVVEWNPAQTRLTGLRHDQVLGQSIWDVLLLSCPQESLTPEIADSLRADTQAALVTGQAAWFNQVLDRQIQRADGTRRIVQSVSFPIQTSRGYMIGSITRDITEYKAAEMRALELTIEREKSDLMARFIGDATHDLKTPLTTLKLSLYLLAKLNDPEKQQRHFDILNAQANHLERLLNDLLSMARLEQVASFRLEPLDLNGLVWEAVQEHDALIERHRHTLAFTADPSNPVVRADRGRLNRAVAALVTNALNYTPDGGQIEVLVTTHNGDAIIEVRDNGVGIKEDDLPHIFDRFYRADQARNVDQGGLGLGLSIAKRIVEGHQGRIEVQTKPGVGSTFCIVLPLNGLTA